jgi:hypothetical protein
VEEGGRRAELAHRFSQEAHDTVRTHQLIVRLVLLVDPLLNLRRDPRDKLAILRDLDKLFDGIGGLGQRLGVDRTLLRRRLGAANDEVVSDGLDEVLHRRTLLMLAGEHREDVLRSIAL